MSQHLVASSVFVLAFLILCSKSNSAFIVEDQCVQGLNFRSIDDFKLFIKEFLELSQDDLAASKPLKLCAKYREAIRDLATLITRDEVCDMQKIDDLVAYHKRYFTGGWLLKNRKPITHEFFTRYAIQVAYSCKKNLLKNLDQATAELKDRRKVFEEARERVYQDEPSIKSNIKLIEEQPDDPATSNVKPQDDAELTLSEYREALTQLRLPEDILTFDRTECANSKSKETLVSGDKIQTFFKPALMCHQLHRYYAGSLLSIAKLANMGYTACDADLDDQLANHSVVRDWIIAVQVCEPMMHMKSSRTQGEMVVVDTCSEKVSAIEPMVFGDSFQDLDNDLLDELVPKSEATRENAQKIMKSTLRKMAKLDLMKALKSGANKRSIFKRSLMVSINKSSNSKSPDRATAAKMVSKFSVELTTGNHISELVPSAGGGFQSKSPQVSDKEAYDILKEVVANDDEQMQAMCPASEDNEIDKPVAFDLLSSVASSIIIMAIMMVFEWVFFVVMTVAARICHELHFDFESLLTFPPKVLSWSDADFARYTDELENKDEDDFFDYEELNPQEQRQRELLAKVFGTPPPMLFKD